MYSQMLHKMPAGVCQMVFPSLYAAAAAILGNSQRKGVRQAVQHMMAGMVPLVEVHTSEEGHVGL